MKNVKKTSPSQNGFTVATPEGARSHLSLLQPIGIRFINCNAEYRFNQLHASDSDLAEQVKTALKEHMTAAQECLRIKRFHPENEKILNVRTERGLVVAKVAYTFPIFYQTKKNILAQDSSFEIAKAIEEDLLDFGCEAQWSSGLRPGLKLQSVWVRDIWREQKLTKELPSLKTKYLGNKRNKMTALEVLSATSTKGK